MPSQHASVTVYPGRATCEPAGISFRHFARSAIVYAPNTTPQSRRRSTDLGRGWSARLAVRRPRRHPADAVDASAAAPAPPRTFCCSSTRRRTTASRTRSPDHWGRTGDSACDSRSHGWRQIFHRTAANCCAADVATTRFVRRRWNAAAVGSTGVVKSSVASVSEWSTSMSASRQLQTLYSAASQSAMVFALLAD